MRIVVASDSFKGSLSSVEVGRIITDVAPRAISEAREVEVVCVPMADGGEGTVDALVNAVGGEERHTCVTGPLGNPVDATWALLSDDTAVIEMAAASGLPLVPESLRNPLATTTRGTGELVLAALDAGASSVVLTIGGSATNDGGMGALIALGVKFFDEKGIPLIGTGADLARASRVDLSCLDARLASGQVSISVMCDVNNPLLGPDGATAVFAPQKGADAACVAQLEEGMSSYAQLSCDALCLDREREVARPGAGAAGGLGFALASFLSAQMRPGIEAVLDTVRLDETLSGADLVITGEGRLDAQTSHGKVISGVAQRCVRSGVPCFAIVGGIEDGTNPQALGLADAVAIAPADMDVNEAMVRASELYALTAHQVLSRWAVGLRS